MDVKDIVKPAVVVRESDTFESAFAAIRNSYFTMSGTPIIERRSSKDNRLIQPNGKTPYRYLY